MRTACVVVLVLTSLPAAASGQAASPSVSIQAGAGPTLVDAGHHLSAAVGFSPLSRMTLFLEVQRTQLSSRVTRTPHSVSRFRGGTLTAVSGELRLGLFPTDRVTPFGSIGIGAGVSHPTVNETFPDRVRNDARFASVGGGIHVPVGDRLSLFGDVRWMLGGEAGELLAMMPVRAGLAWRF